MSFTDLKLSPIRLSDLLAVARVHMAAFPDRALTMLGTEAVRRYYEWQLTGPHQVTALGVYQDQRLLGYCFGGRFRGASSGFVKRNWLFLLARLLSRPGLIMNGLIRKRAAFGFFTLANFLQFRPVQTDGQLEARPPSFGILAIAVDPQQQGKGVGRLLMEESEQAAKRGGYQQMHLTVETNNDQAIRFYELLGWEKYSKNGGWEGKMHKSLLK